MAHWLGDENHNKLLIHDIANYPWTSNDKMSREQQDTLRGWVAFPGCISVRLRCTCVVVSRWQPCIVRDSPGAKDVRYGRTSTTAYAVFWRWLLAASNSGDGAAHEKPKHAIRLCVQMRSRRAVDEHTCNE